jgi:hypothetical protein
MHNIGHSLATLSALADGEWWWEKTTRRLFGARTATTFAAGVDCTRHCHPLMRSILLRPRMNCEPTCWIWEECITADCIEKLPMQAQLMRSWLKMQGFATRLRLQPGRSRPLAS